VSAAAQRAMRVLLSLAFVAARRVTRRLVLTAPARGMSTSPLHKEPTSSDSRSPLQGCYLLHFDQPYKSGRHPAAQHYVGYSDDIDRRIEMHRKGHGSPLLAAALAVGIDFRVVRTWPGTDRHFERKLHIRHGSRLCPETECVSQAPPRSWSQRPRRDRNFATALRAGAADDLE
jgi:hypothetical protein